MHEASLGLLMILLAGAMNGSFAVPMKVTRRWAWENTWLMWTIFGLFVLPPLTTAATIPDMTGVYRDSGFGIVAIVAACGAGWGISVVFLGLAIEAVGVAVSFSIMLGLSAAVGSLIPLLSLHSDKIATPAGIVVLWGLALVLVGVGICAVAGKQRETALGVGAPGRPSIVKGLIFCVIGGLGSALVNLGLAFGGPILKAAQAHGATLVSSSNAAFFPLMLAGGIPSLIYCVYLIRKNRTANRFSEAGTSYYWLFAALMAVLWFGSTILYGSAATSLGQLGAVLGWPLFMSVIVITAAVWGVITGEWRGSGRKPRIVMACGVTILVVAIFVLSLAGRQV
ncbi:MAG TPA: L-rhamnose/proton symporter RhaT [Verrucomicrobiae bacterium]|nr:L-rhamnose/proton symporter RhaT [Verrucomicrobiae bacterium]